MPPAFKAVIQFGEASFEHIFLSSASLRDVKAAVERRWPELEAIEYQISWDFVLLYDESAFQTAKEMWADNVKEEIVLKVESLCKSFADFSLEEASAYLGVPPYLPYRDREFQAADLESDVARRALDHALDSITRRIHVFGPLHEGATYSNREFVTPVLLAAATIVGDVLLRAGYKLQGSRGHGSVDYMALCSGFPVVISEARQSTIIDATPQNLARIAASREQFVREHPSIGTDPKALMQTGLKRKVREMTELERLPSSAILTTAEKYVFLRYEQSPSVPPCMFKSNEYHIGFQTRHPELLRWQVSEVLARIVGIFMLHKEAVTSDAGLKRLKP